MRKKLLTLVFALVCATTVYSQTATINWHDSTRDVYVANELDPSAQVLTADSPSRIALISSKLDRAIVLDVNERTVSAVSKDAFRFAADRTSATSDSSAQTEPLGKFTRVDGPVYVFVVDGRPVVIRAHPGATGEMTLDKLWQAVPVWRSVMESYQPHEQAVAAIKASDKEASVTVVYGTWCPDSKNYVPRVLKALQSAGNKKINVRLVGVDNQFHEPVDTVQPRGITNVPTVIVERNGQEIGRIVETPAAKTMEEDLAAILNGKPNEHKGRWDRGPKIASGVYSYRDASGKERGNETWDLYSTSEGGYLLHSHISAGDVMTEVFHRVDARRRPTFVEVTKQRGDERVRTRYTIDGHTLTARVRGSNAGVITQTIEVPDRLILVSPAVAAQGWLLEPASPGQGVNQVTSYLAPAEFDKAAGTLVQASISTKAEETLRITNQEIRARHITRKAGNELVELWLHPQLGIPVRGQTTGGLQYALTSLEVTPPNK